MTYNQISSGNKGIITGREKYLSSSLEDSMSHRILNWPESSAEPFPTAPQSLTLMTSERRSGSVRFTLAGAPVAAKLKSVKVVSAFTVRDGLNAKAPTALPNNSLRWVFSTFIVHLPSH